MSGQPYLSIDPLVVLPSLDVQDLVVAEQADTSCDPESRRFLLRIQRDKRNQLAIGAELCVASVLLEVDVHGALEVCDLIRQSIFSFIGWFFDSFALFVLF